jgi:hypothetical protein
MTVHCLAMATHIRERATAPSRIDVLLQQPMDWERPSRTEVAVTGAFITRQGGQIHHGLGGPSQLDVERRRYGAFRPYLLVEGRSPAERKNVSC